MLRKILLIMLVLISFITAQTTSTFTFQLRSKTTGKLVPGKNVDLYQDGVKLYDLTESSPGIYTNANVPTGTYDVYVNGNALPDYQDIPHTGKKVKTVEDRFNSASELQASGIGDNQVTLSKLSSTVRAQLNGSGPVRPPDDVSVEYKIAGVDTTVGFKDSYLSTITMVNDSASLKLSDVNVKEKYMWGYSSGSSIGGGKFVVIDKGTNSANGMTYFSTTDPNKLYVRLKYFETQKIDVGWGSVKSDSTDISTSITSMWSKIPNNSTVVFPKGTYYLKEGGTELSGVSNLNIVFEEGAKFYGAKNNTASTWLRFYNSSIANSTLGVITTGFDYTDFVQVTGEEVKKNTNFIRVTDTTSWINTGLKRGDMVVVASSVGQGINSYRLSATFLFDRYGVEGADQVIYSQKPLRQSFKIDSNADLHLIGANYAIYVYPLNRFSMTGGVFKDMGVTVSNVRDGYISSMIFSNTNGKEANQESALLVEKIANSTITDINVDNYHKAESGYGIGATTFSGLLITNSTFTDCRHAITTGSDFYNYVDGLNVVNCYSYYSDDQAGLHYAFDTHLNAYDITYKNVNTFNALYLISMRSHDLTLEFSKAVHSAGVVHANDLGLDSTDSFINMNNVRFVNPTGKYFLLLTDSSNSKKITINNCEIKSEDVISEAQIVYNGGSRVDSLLINNFIYDVNTVTGYASSLIRFNPINTSTFKYISINNLIASNFGSVASGGVVSPVDEILIKNSNLSYFNSIVDINYGSGGANSSDTTNSIASKIIIKDNTLKSYLRPIGHSAINVKIDTVMFERNDVDFQYRGFGNRAISRGAYHLYKNNTFDNSFVASANVFENYIKSTNHVEKLSFIGNEINDVIAASVTVDNAERVNRGFTAESITIPTRIGIFEDKPFSFEFEFTDNKWYAETDTTSGSAAFLRLRNDAGGGDYNIDISNNIFKPSNEKMGKTASAGYAFSFISTFGNFDNNLIVANGDSMSVSWVLFSSASMSAINNTFVSSNTKAASYPILFSGTATQQIGGNKNVGFATNSSVGGAITVEPLVHEWLYLRDITTGTVYEVYISGGSLLVR
jgi:hypothetical protein